MSGPSSWELDTANALTVLGNFEGMDDPEDTLVVAMTRREFGLILWAIQVLSRMAPESGKYGLAFYAKLTELAEGQGFLDIGPYRDELGDIFRDENDEPLLGGA